MLTILNKINIVLWFQFSNIFISLKYKVNFLKCFTMVKKIFIMENDSFNWYISTIWTYWKLIWWTEHVYFPELQIPHDDNKFFLLIKSINYLLLSTLLCLQKSVITWRCYIERYFLAWPTRLVFNVALAHLLRFNSG